MVMVAGVGAVATQSFASLDYGIKGLKLIENGAGAAATALYPVIS